jgi:hypothetical protein
MKSFLDENASSFEILAKNYILKLKKLKQN